MAIQPPIIHSGWSVGSAAAEDDRDLFEVFLENGSFDSLHDMADHRSFLIGRTGAGKSAALNQIEVRENRRAIRINPVDFAFQYLTNNDMVEQLQGFGVDLSPFFRSLWQHILIVEIINHEFNINDESGKDGAFQRIRSAPGSTRARETALNYLDEFGSDFWEPAHVRVKQITENFQERLVRTGGSGSVKAAPFGLGIDAGLSTQRGVAEADKTLEEVEVRQRYQSVVARSLAPKMAEVTKIIDEVVLSNDRNPVYVLIDDLDRELSDEAIRLDLVRCLFDAAIELQRRVRNLKILIALRTNIFGQLGYERSKYYQVEKIRDSIHTLDWSRYELRSMVDLRLERLSRRRNLRVPVTLQSILPARDDRHGDPFEWMLDRTLLRPRDLIIWVNEILRRAAGTTGVSWADMERIERTVSGYRLEGLRDEWQDPYSGIESLFECFRAKSGILSIAEYMDLVRLDVAALLADDDFVGGPWLNEMIRPLYEPEKSPPKFWFQNYLDLSHLLWTMSFLGFSSGPGETPIFSIDEEAEWNPSSMITEDSIVAVHPGFRTALDMV